MKRSECVIHAIYYHTTDGICPICKYENEHGEEVWQPIINTT